MLLVQTEAHGQLQLWVATLVWLGQLIDTKNNFNVSKSIIVNQIAAISVGVVKTTPCIDLNYIEDSGC